MLADVLEGVNYVILAYFILLNTTYLVTSLLAFGALRRYARRLQFFRVREVVAASSAPPISLVLPTYNEESNCVESARSVLSLQYPQVEILIVNDGSKDATLLRLITAFELEPTIRYPTAELATAHIRGVYRSRIHTNMWVIDKENGGKADALNAGLNFCRTPLFCAMDADSLLERDALVRIVRPFLEDAKTVAAGGIIRIVNGCTVDRGTVQAVRLPRNLLARFQVLEYLRAFLFGRVGWGAADILFIISGAFGLFRRDIVVEAGGYATDTVGEDMELIVRLHRFCRAREMDYRIPFVPDPVAWTECPETIRVLAHQRDRWQRGLTQALVRHRRMLFNPLYGRIGLVAYPYFFFLEMIGPAIETVGYAVVLLSFLMGWVSATFALAFFLVAVVMGVVLSVAAVALEELSFRRYDRLTDLLQLFALAIAENFGYRQLTSYWRAKGLWSYLRGHEHWGHMERKGFSTGPADEA